MKNKKAKAKRKAQMDELLNYVGFAVMMVTILWGIPLLAWIVK